jgi:hypothetical protein
MQEVAEARIGFSLDDVQLAKLHEDTEAIRQDVVSQLEAIGVYTGAKADLFAQITAQRYAARAIRMTEETGQPVDALELFMADNVRIQGRMREQSAAVLEQSADQQAALSQAAIQRENREITEEQYLEIVARLKPVTPYKKSAYAWTSPHTRTTIHGCPQFTAQRVSRWRMRPWRTSPDRSRLPSRVTRLKERRVR